MSWSDARCIYTCKTHDFLKIDKQKIATYISSKHFYALHTIATNCCNLKHEEIQRLQNKKMNKCTIKEIYTFKN